MVLYSYEIEKKHEHKREIIKHSFELSPCSAGFDCNLSSNSPTPATGQMQIQLQIKLQTIAFSLNSKTETEKLIFTN